MTIPFHLGRLQEPTHPKVYENLVSAIVPKTVPKSAQWPSNVTLDQGQTPACVGFSQATSLASSPVPEGGLSNSIGLEIYAKAQTLDPWANQKHSGSTVTAGMKAIMALFPGIYDSYKWALTLNDVLTAIEHVGPVIMGTNWYSSMFYPDPTTHVLKLDESTGLAGGHAYMLWSQNVDSKLFGIHNSWGASWGLHGKAFIHFSALEKLLLEPNGQCLVPMGKKPVHIS